MHELAKVVTVEKWQLKKFDGDPPKAEGRFISWLRKRLPERVVNRLSAVCGSYKEPVEIIEGGDGLPTRVVYRKGENGNGTH